VGIFSFFPSTQITTSPKYPCNVVVMRPNVWDPIRRCDVAQSVQQNYNSYLLFYERCQPENNPSLDVVVQDKSKIVPKELNQVWDKNVKFLVYKYLFDKDDLDFIQSLLRLFDPNPLCSSDWWRIFPLRKIRCWVLQLGTRFLIQPLAHAYKNHTLCLPL